ncbi:MAG: methyltransferase domain-containing protein [Flavobacteriales bacterium]|nr:methyltransferase domain-containing protein [Flavobacteriales bacterium]
METSFRHFPAEAHPHRLSANAFLLRRLEPRMHVLDLGCGSGDITAVIAAYVDRVVGVDHDRVAVARAAQRHQRANLTFVDRDAMAFLQQEEQRFDTLVLLRAGAPRWTGGIPATLQRFLPVDLHRGPRLR